MTLFFIKRYLVNEKGEGTFIVLMTSLSVILLAFFILLNAIAVIDDQRVLRAYGSLIGAFHILPGGYSAIGGGGSGLSFPSPPITDLNDFFKSILNKFEEKLYEDGFGEDVGILMSRSGLTVTLSSNIAFSPGSSELTKEGKDILKRISRMLKRIPNKIGIEGHTDSLPIHTKRYPSNWELSVDRAVSTLDYLVNKEQIKEKRFYIIGYADSKPLFNNPKLIHKNRRIAIVLSNGK